MNQCSPYKMDGVWIKLSILETNKCLTYLPTYIIITYIPYLLNYDTSPLMDVGTLGVGLGKGLQNKLPN